MNLGYFENGDKVFVIDENGNKSERENTKYIYDILSYENSLEKIDYEYNCYLRRWNIEKTNLIIESKNKKIKNIFAFLACSFSNCMFLSIGNPEYLAEFFLGSFGIASICSIISTFIDNNKIEKSVNNIKKIEYIIESLNKEKDILEKKLRDIKNRSNIADKEESNKKDNEQINYRKMDEEFDIGLDNKIRLIENTAEKKYINNKPKTLKKVRK